MNYGNSKTARFGHEYGHRYDFAQSHWHEEAEGRGFDCRSKAAKGIHRSQESGCRKEALAVYPIGQEPIQKAGEVALSLLGFLDVNSVQRDENALLSLGRSASTFAPASDLLFHHVLKKYIRFPLTASEIVYTYSRMANKRLSKEKQVYVLAALSEGMPINAVCRTFRIGKHAVLRVIEETGEALGDYMKSEFRDLPCDRVAMDEVWQYVGKHGQRMAKRELERGDFWMWTAIDSDTKLVFSFVIGRRDRFTCEEFIKDAASRVVGTVQVVSDAWKAYERHIPEYFTQNGASHATETKVFKEYFDSSSFPVKRRHGIKKIVAAERETRMGYPDLRTATTSHCERFFLTLRQELKRYQRLGLGFSKDLDMHKAATALHIGLYNLVRRHSSLDGQTPAQAAGIEDKRWSMEDVVALTARHMQAKEDAKFEAAFAEAGL